MLLTLLVAHSVSRSCKHETLGSGGHSWQKNKNEKIRDQTKKVGHSWQAAAHASEGCQGVVPGDQGVQDQALEQVELFAGVERQVHRGGNAQLQDGCDRKRGTSSDLPK